MKIVSLLIVSMLLLGCKTLDSPSVGNISADFRNSVQEQIEQTEEIKNATELIARQLGDIDLQAENILNEIALMPEDQINNGMVSIEDSAETIKETVDEAQKEHIRIDESLEDLESANHRASSLLTQTKKLEQLLEEYKESDREVRREALENLHSYITLFFVIGFATVLIGAFLTFWVNGKLGGVVLGVGVLTVGFAAASQYYLQEIAVVGLIVLILGFVVTLGVIIWLLLDGKNDKVAMKEIVSLVEAMKHHLTEEERKQIFGPTGLASRMTSDLTKKVVSQIKIKNGLNKP
jgi:hypothetical protein